MTGIPMRSREGREGRRPLRNEKEMSTELKNLKISKNEKKGGQVF